MQERYLYEKISRLDALGAGATEQPHAELLAELLTVFLAG